MFPTFDWFLMLALLMGMIRGHDDDRRHPVPEQLWQARYERRADLLLGFVYLACALICLNSLNRPKGGRRAVAW
jgi:hypothetical protein